MKKLLSLPPNLVRKDSEGCTVFHRITGLDPEEYFCTCDPEGRRVGSGGGTAWLLWQAYLDSSGSHPSSLNSQLSTLNSQLSTKRPTVTSGEMHYGTWHAVGGKNYLAQIFRDAGAEYVIDDDETAGEDIEFEKMYALSANADYWRILNSFAGDFTYDDLLSREQRNALLKAFRERKVIYCNMQQTPYYESSPVEPDVLLKDFVAIFHPTLVESSYQPKYYKLLK